MADSEERLIQTESLLVNAKASWAASEHEKEILSNQFRDLEQIINDKVEGGIDAIYRL